MEKDCSRRKNVLLLCLSKITNVRKNTYIGEDGSKLEGFFTNEAPVKYVIQSLENQNPPQKLDRIVIICSDTVKSKIDIKVSEKDNANVKRDKEEFLEKISEIAKKKETSESVTHLEYYKSVVESAVRTNEDIPEYTLVDISDNPEDEEVAQSVIQAVNGILEFPERGEDIHLYIDYNGGPRYVSFMQVVLAQFMAIHNVHIEAIYSMNYMENGITEIKNLYSIFDSVNLLSCISEYIKYGRVEGLRAYFEKAFHEEPTEEENKISDILRSMEAISNNLQLCHTTAILESRKEILKKLEGYIASTNKSTGQNDIYKQLFAFVVWDIYGEYKDLLKGDLSHIIKWCIRKKYIQQALTFCTEEMPLEFWNKGIIRDSNQKEYVAFLEKLDELSNANEEEVDEDLKKAADELKKYFSHCSHTGEILTGKDASCWLNNYMQFYYIKDEYKIITRQIKEHDSFGDGSKKLQRCIQKRIIKQGYLEEILGVGPGNNKMNDPLDYTSKVMLNYESGRIWSEVTREELEELLLTYYFLRKQRNATNHAGSSDFSYEQICKTLEYLVERLD